MKGRVEMKVTVRVEVGDEQTAGKSALDLRQPFPPDFVRTDKSRREPREDAVVFSAGKRASGIDQRSDLMRGSKRTTVRQVEVDADLEGLSPAQLWCYEVEALGVRNDARPSHHAAIAELEDPLVDLPAQAEVVGRDADHPHRFG
jgi:hypothetical protein